MIIVLCGVKRSGKDTIGDLLVKNHSFTKLAFADPMKKMVKLAFPAFTDEDLYGSSSARENEYPQYPLSGCPYCGGEIIYDKYDNRGGSYKLMEDPLGHRRCGANSSHDWLPKFLSPRIALQTLGTEWGRRLYSDVWIDAAFEHIKNEGRPSYDTLGHQMIDPATKEPVTLEKWSAARRWVITDCRFFNEAKRSKELGARVVLLERGLEASTSTHQSETELRTIPREMFDHIFAETTLEALPAAVEDMFIGMKTAELGEMYGARRGP